MLYRNRETGEVVETSSHVGKPGTVSFHHQGGGYVRHTSPEAFERDFKRLPDNYYETCPWKPSVFGIDDLIGPLAGYSRGDHWNGWACPAFTREIAAQIRDLDYVQQHDSFTRMDENTDEMDVWAGFDAETTDGPRRLYAVGAHAWTWDDWAPKDPEAFRRFTQTARVTQDLSELCPEYEPMKDWPGRVYLGDLWMADTTDWPPPANGKPVLRPGRWYVHTDGADEEFFTDDLRTAEIVLFQKAISYGLEI